jgi:hypothetical protein
MSYKDASTKQTQDYRDFNHFGAPHFIMGTSIADPGFRPGFFGAEKWFRLTPAVGRGRPLSPAAPLRAGRPGRFLE